MTLRGKGAQNPDFELVWNIPVKILYMKAISHKYYNILYPNDNRGFNSANTGQKKQGNPRLQTSLMKTNQNS